LLLVVCDVVVIVAGVALVAACAGCVYTLWWSLTIA